jgi:hypothetical protein
MDVKLRKLHAAISYCQIPKKSLARHCGVSRSLFSMYLMGDLVMPPDIEDRLMARIKRELQEIRAHEAPALQQGVVG